MLPKFSQIVNRLYAFIYETNHSKSELGLPSIVALVMIIDKSWKSLGKQEKAFYTSLKKFIDDCKPLVDSAGNIRCPCKSCRLVLWVSIKHLSDHISKYGFDPSYKTWIHHGESDLPPPPPVIDNTRQPQISDMTACLNDLSYIPLYNEQNEPTQGDIGETSNDSTQAKRNEFEELYASANDELYPGCDYVTRLDFMAKFTYFKGDANKDVHFCPVCNTSRWKDSNTPGKKVPKKVLRYFPIIPRLQHLYKSSHTAKEMTWTCYWKEYGAQFFKIATPWLAADGFNPFGNLSQSYIMWLMILTTYNQPPWLCMKESSFMLTLLIHGPKSPGKDIDVYLRPLIDDLKDLWAKPGVETIDVTIGLKACPTCNEDTPSVRVLGKTAYVGHKRFLKKPHKWRRSLEFNGETGDEDPPKEFSRNAIMTQLARLPTRVKEDRKKFCQFIKRIKLPDGFGSNFKHKVTDNDTNITGLKSHDYHIMMQYLLPYRLQKYLPLDVSKPLIELCLFFKQIYSQTLMVDDMLKAQSKDVTTKFNRPDRNVDCPPPTCQFQVNGCEVCRTRRDERRNTQNSGICLPGPDEEMYYGQLEQILEFSYLSFKTVLFRVKWFDTSKKGHVDVPPDIIDVVDEDDDIIDEEDPIPHDLADSDDEDLANLDIDDGVNVMSADVARCNTPKIGSQRNVFPGALLHNTIAQVMRERPLSSTGAETELTSNSLQPKMSPDVARGHGDDGGDDDRPPPYQIPNRGKGTRKPNLGGRRAGMLHTRQETRNLGLKAITDKNGPVPIRFEFGDRETLMPLDEHAAHWANYLGELVREFPLHYPSWRKMPPERKAGVIAKIGTQFDLRPHMESGHWPQIYAGIQQPLQKIYNGKKVALKERHWVPDEDGTYDVKRIRRGRPSHISKVDWDAQIAFWNDPKNLARAAQNKQNRAKSKVRLHPQSPSFFKNNYNLVAEMLVTAYLNRQKLLPETIAGVRLNDVASARG
ncbi:retrotransposon gag domain, retroviral aspartyl protease [Tanacetum coccineum]